MRHANTYAAPQKKRSSGLWKTLLDILLVLVTLALAAALVMAYIATGVNPNERWVFAFFGLAAPFLFFGNFLLLLIWAVRWRWWALVPLITLLFGLGHLASLVRFDFGRKYHDEPVTASELRVMTYNVHGFSFKQRDHAGYLTLVDSVASYARAQAPDVICFQEYETMSRSDVERVDSLFRDWPYKVYHFIIGGRDSIGFGQAIFSRHPILEREQMVFPHSANSMLLADLLWRGDTVRIFNNHLQSVQLDEDVQRRIENLDVREEPELLMRSVGSRLKQNYRRRANQVDTVAQLIAATPYPVIVTGDFNDTPVSYTYERMRGDLRDSFIEKGSGFGFTFNRLFSMLRIDYIFHSPELETVAYRSDELPFSDHNPVVARILFPQ